MNADALKAAQIYAQIAAAKAAGPAAGAAAAERPDFAAMVKTAVADTASIVKAGEQAAMNVAAGDANLVDVVTAISAAEVSLEAAIAVRNKVVEAYQEIMRMPI